VYTGERLTLNFQDIEHARCCSCWADASGQNIVGATQRWTRQRHPAVAERAVGPGARYRAAHQGLDKRRQDNVIIVAPQAELATREKASWPARKDVQELAPLRSEYLQVNYARPGHGGAHQDADQFADVHAR